MTCDECQHLVQYADMWGQDEWCGLGQEPANCEMNNQNQKGANHGNQDSRQHGIHRARPWDG